MKNGIIYKFTSPNGKIYIGQTINWTIRLSAYKNLKCKSQKRLYNSFLKYGFENFHIEILKNNVHENLLGLFEQCYIAIYDSYLNGLNMTEGGEISPMKNPETAKKVSNTKKGCVAWNKGLTKEDPRVAKNILGGEKTRFKNGHKSCVGRTYSEKTIKKMSNTAMKTKEKHKKNSLGQYTS